MKVVRYLLIVAAIVFVLVLTTELLWRVVNPQTMEADIALRTSNELLGMSSSDVLFRLDSNGLRGYNWADKREPGAIRMLVVGGQTTNHLLQNPENLWWGQLAGMLEKNGGKKVEAAAVNIPGHLTISNGYGAAVKALEKVKVDLIVVMFGLGDVLFHPENFVFDAEKFDKIASAKPDESLGKSLSRHSHFLRWIRNGRAKKRQAQEYNAYRRPNYFTNNMASMVQRYQELPMRASLTRKDDPLKEYLLGIEKFKELADKHGASLVVVGEPTLHHLFISGAERGRLHIPAINGTQGGAPSYVRVSPDWIEKELNRYYFSARDACGKAGTPFVFLNGEIPRYVENFLTETILTDKGATMAAERIFPEAVKAASEKGP